MRFALAVTGVVIVLIGWLVLPGVHTLAGEQVVMLTPGSTPAEKDDYNQGISAFEHEDYQAAIISFTRAIELCPDYADAYHYRGICYERLGDYENALADFQRSIALNPAAWYSYQGIGNIYYAQGEYELAMDAFTQSLAISPYAGTYFNRALVYAAQGHYTAAIDDYTQALKLDPALVDGYYSRGLAYTARGDQRLAQGDAQAASQDFKLAVRDMNTIIEDLDPNHIGAHYTRSTIYYRLEEYGLSVLDASWVLERDPAYLEAYYVRGSAALELEDFAQAIADYTTIIEEFDPNYADAYWGRGAAYFMQDDFERAIADWKQVLKLGSEEVDLYKWIGRAYVGLGDYHAALVMFERYTILSTPPDELRLECVIRITMQNLGLLPVKYCDLFR